MKKEIYFTSMKMLMAELIEREFRVNEIHKLFGRMFNVIWYRKKLKESETSENEALARWSLSDAQDNLNEIMRDYSFDEDIKRAIRNLVKEY